MRTESASSIKAQARGGSSPDLQRVPREGTRLRALYDLLWKNRGLFIDLGPLDSRIQTQLRDFYCLDIRSRPVAYRQPDQVGRKGGRRHHEWCLAGEWVGKVYVDYCAERLDQAAPSGPR